MNNTSNNFNIVNRDDSGKNVLSPSGVFIEVPESFVFMIEPENYERKIF